MAPSSSSSKDKRSKEKSKPSSIFSAFSRKHNDGSDEESSAPKSKKSHGKKATKAPQSEMLDSKFFRDESAAPSSRHEPARLPTGVSSFSKSNKVKSKNPERGSKHAESLKKSQKLANVDESDDPDWSDFKTTYAEPPKASTKESSQPPKPAKPSKRESSRLESEEPNFSDFQTSYNEVPKAAPKMSHQPINVQSASRIKSMAPPNIKCMFTAPKDEEMARRQTKIESLSPTERKKQDQWAQTMISKIGNCPQDRAWNRFQLHNLGGYRCTGKGHFISDELLAEGKGGLWKICPGPGGEADTNLYKCGPYYPDPTTPRRFIYAGLPGKLFIFPDGWTIDPGVDGDKHFFIRPDGSVFTPTREQTMQMDEDELYYMIYGTMMPEHVIQALEDHMTTEITTPDNGFPGNGYSRNGYSGNGYPGYGYPGYGYPGNGFPGNGMPFFPRR